jgi:hypothetical protein
VGRTHYSVRCNSSSPPISFSVQFGFTLGQLDSHIRSQVNTIFQRHTWPAFTNRTTRSLPLVYYARLAQLFGFAPPSWDYSRVPYHLENIIVPDEYKQRVENILYFSNPTFGHLYSLPDVDFPILCWILQRNLVTFRWLDDVGLEVVTYTPTPWPTAINLKGRLLNRQVDTGDLCKVNIGMKPTISDSHEENTCPLILVFAVNHWEPLTHPGISKLRVLNHDVLGFTDLTQSFEGDDDDAGLSAKTKDEAEAKSEASHVDQEALHIVKEFVASSISSSSTMTRLSTPSLLSLSVKVDESQPDASDNSIGIGISTTGISSSDVPETPLSSSVSVSISQDGLDNNPKLHAAFGRQFTSSQDSSGTLVTDDLVMPFSNMAPFDHPVVSSQLLSSSSTNNSQVPVSVIHATSAPQVASIPRQSTDHVVVAKQPTNSSQEVISSYLYSFFLSTTTTDLFEINRMKMRMVVVALTPNYNGVLKV